MTGLPYEAICVGGPLDGSPWLSRFPRGFVLADKPRRMVWIYKWDGHNWRIDPAGHAGDNRWLSDDAALQAALGADFDVVALPQAGER